MSVAITCSSCNRPLRVPEGVLGQTVQCPLCLDEFIAQADPAAEAAARASEPPPSRTAARSQGVTVQVGAAAEPPPLLELVEEEPVVVEPVAEEVADRPAAQQPSPQRTLFFPVIVTRDPDRILRGPMDAALTAQGLHLRKPRQPSALAAVGGRARYLGGNRLLVTVEGREVEVAIVKKWTSTYHLARDTAAFLAGAGDFPDARSYRIPWYLYAIPPLFIALPFTAAPFGLLTDGCLGAFLWTVIALALGGAALAVALQARLKPRTRLIVAESILGLGVLLPLVAIPFSPRYTVDASLWKTFTSPEGDFSVLMPGTPNAQPAVFAPAVQTYTVDVTSPELQFTLLVDPRPKADDMHFRSVVGESQDLLTGILAASRTPDEERDVSSGGQWYHQVLYRASSYNYGPMAGKTLAARLYVANGRVYTLAVAGPHVTTDAPDVVKFFNSIRFTATAPVKTDTNTGVVSAVNDNSIRIKPVAGNIEWKFTVPVGAQVMIDGKVGRLMDVPVRSAVTVTSQDGKVVKVEAKSPPPVPPPAPPPPPHQDTFDGTILAARGLVLRVVDDNFGQRAYILADDVSVTIDGIDAAAGDLRKGQRAKFTTLPGSDIVVRIDVKTK